MTYIKPSAVASIGVASSHSTASGGGSDDASNDDDEEEDDNGDDDEDDDVVIINSTSTASTTPALASAPATSSSDILNHRRACFACVVSAPSPTDDHVIVRIGASTNITATTSTMNHADATVVTRVPLEQICPPLTIEQVLQALQHFDKDEALANITR